MEIELQEAGRTFTRRGEQLFAVKNLNLKIRQGEFLFLTGISGSGKTTMLQLISGMLSVTSGRILMDGKMWREMTDQEAAVFRNRHIGFIPQEDGLLSNLTVFENICLPYTFSDEVKPQEEKAVQLAKRFCISHLLEAYPKELSGGEKRRAVIARAMILCPEILLADEPTANLDEKNSKEVMEALKDMNQNGTTVIVSTHEKDIIFGSKVYRLNEGIMDKMGGK